MANSKLSLHIKNGPSKLDLAVALVHVPSNGERDHILTFVLESGSEVKAILRGLVMEDGSHDSWLIQGYVEESGAQFTGYFDTRDRHGYLNIESKPKTGFGFAP